MFMEVGPKLTEPDWNSKFSLEHLKEEAEDLLKETDRLARNLPKVAVPVDPGFVSSFVSYPAGIAHSYAFFSHFWFTYSL
ncbi:hypothetical protein AZE42_09880 [Rhizopogon vesiculosus]|uniref:Uncharacterized protein n=1 Tax=Rhizopogon vesiculosus TaxID=180088 RepID=A0A1J8R1E0_9AGAM|nr:hypothetical protein AZE42_09880 [Rhizopogon vesiculosus]